MPGVYVVAVLLILVNSALVSAQECLQVDPRNISSACLFGGLEIVMANVTVRDENCNAMQNKNEFKKMPQVKMPRAKRSKTYVLFMLDPDIPGYQPGSFYNHLILGKIPGDELQDGLLKSARTTLRYREPDPPSPTGIHRYMFLVYEQQNPNVSPMIVPEDRRSNWSLVSYITSQKTKFCGPVAGTQFRSKA